MTRIWTPVSPGLNYFDDDEVGLIVSLDGSLLTMFPITQDEKHDQEASMSLQLDPNKYRLCQATEDAAPVPLDFPDSAGGWAAVSKQHRFIVWWSEFRIEGDDLMIRWGDDGYVIPYPLEGFRRDYPDTKWYKLNLPWQAQPSEEDK
jgi:predicted dehydrogenase